MKPVQSPLLFLMRDYLPAFRPDVAVLFGKELPRLGVHSDLLGQQDARALPQAWPGGAVHLSGRERASMWGDFTRAWHDLALLLRHGGGHDVVQVRDKIRSGLLALAWARCTGRRFVYWMSFPIVEGLQERATQVGRTRGPVVAALNRWRAGLARYCFYRWVAPKADHLFVQSEAMLSFMLAHGVPAARMTAVPMGVDLDLFEQLGAATPLPPALQGRPVLAYLGALGRARQSDFLLEVLRLVRLQRPEVALLLAGDGASADESAWIRAQVAASEQAAHVHVSGWLPQAQALALLKSAQIGLSPVPRGVLFDVSSPTKAVEYLALGLPVVGNDIPDQRLVLERSGGGLCVPMQAEAFAQAVLALLADPQASAQRGVQGRAWVREQRSYAVLARQVAAVYARLQGARA